MQDSIHSKGMDFNQITTWQPELKYPLQLINNIEWTIPHTPLSYLGIYFQVKQSLTFLTFLSVSNPIVVYLLQTSPNLAICKQFRDTRPPYEVVS